MIPGALGVAQLAGDALDYTGGGATPSYAAKPAQKIALLRLGVRLQNERQQRELDLNTSLPMITRSIAEAQETERKQHELIERTKVALAAPPPDEPTAPDPNLGEALAGSLAAALSGGGMGAARAANDTVHVAMDRQVREFQNKFRRYGLERENNLRTLDMARQDELDARGYGRDLAKEGRATSLDLMLQKLNLQQRGLDRDVQLQSMGINMQHDDEQAAKQFANQKELLDIGLKLDKEKAKYMVDLDRETENLRAKRDENSKIRLDGIQRLRDLVEKGTPDQVRAAVGELSKSYGIYFDGKGVAAMVAAAEWRDQMAEREMAARERAVEFRDPANAQARPLSVGDAVQLQNFINENGQMPATLGGTVQGGLPVPAGGVGMGGVPAGGQVVPMAPAMPMNRFNLKGPALTAFSTVAGARSSHKQLIAQNPYPAIKSQKDADEKLSLSQRKQWATWNKSVQESARSLAAAKAKYLALLPRPARQAMQAQAEQDMAQIQALAKGASSAANAQEFRDAQDAIRASFQETFGVDIDAALPKKGAKK